MNCSVVVRDVWVDVGTREKVNFKWKCDICLGCIYHALITGVGWKTGIILQTGDEFVIRCDDNYIYPVSDIEDVELENITIVDDTDYTKEVAWQYRDEHNHIIPIYMDDRVRLKTIDGGFVTGRVQYDEEIKKYYVDTIIQKYFFYLGVDVEKVEVKNDEEN